MIDVLCMVKYNFWLYIVFLYFRFLLMEKLQFVILFFYMGVLLICVGLVFYMLKLQRVCVIFYDMNYFVLLNLFKFFLSCFLFVF